MDSQVHKETKEVALLISDSMVSDSWFENHINRVLKWLEYFCNIRYVLRKYVQRCRRPKVKAA